jgi:density-regulated protein DRP1
VNGVHYINQSVYHGIYYIIIIIIVIIKILLLRILKNCPNIISNDENIINEMISKLTIVDDNTTTSDNNEDDKKSKKGKKAAKGPPETKVIIGLVQRQKKKYVTVIAGLETVPDLKLKDAAKIFGKKYASGVTINEAQNGSKEVVIQGDVHLVIPQLLISDFKIAPTSLFFLEEDQRSIRPYA